MKLTVFFVLFSLLQVHASVYSQITIKENHTSIEKIIREIERQTDYVFFYKGNLKNVDFNINLKNASITEALDVCFKNLPLSYKIIDKTIVVTQTNLSPTVSSKIASDTEIKGRVTDSTGAAISNATVRIKGTKKGIVTDNNGVYMIKVSPDDKILVFSFIGMKDQEVEIKSRNFINVVMQNNVIVANDVVITGFFEKKKDSYTGSSVTFTGEQLKSISPTNVIQALAMVTPGLIAVQQSANGSNPNNLPDILIRGVTSFNNNNPTVNAPLIVRDGTIIELADLYDMNINEIASVTVLKDASAAALYGAKAANGVIVIERNKIAEGKLRVSYNLIGSVQLPDFSDYNLLNPSDKLEYERLAGLYSTTDNTLKPGLDSLYNYRFKEISRGVNTDWLAQPARVGFSLEHAIRLAGGSGSTRFELNARFGEVNGVMKGDFRNRYGLGFVLEHYMPNGLSFTNRTNFIQVNSKASPYGLFSEYSKANPYDRIYDNFGNLIKTLSWDLANPLYEAQLGSFNRNTTQALSNDFDARWRISKEWRVTTHWNLTLNNGKAEIYQSPESNVYKDFLLQNTKGAMQITNLKNVNYSGNAVVSYNKYFTNESLFTINAGANITNTDMRNESFTGIGFYSDALRSINFASAYPTGGAPSGNQDLSTDVGAFANINYMYKSRYYFDGVYQVSGSSKFGENNRYGTFWSTGLGWNLHNEEIFKNGWLDILKLRTSMGYTGKVNFSSYLAQTTYRYNNTLDYLNGIGAVPITIGNADLKWEKTMNYNVGVDVSLFKRWFNLTFDIYKRNTSDLLIDKTIAPSAGVTSGKDNLGKMENKGIELHMDSYIIRNNQFTLQAGLNATRNTNKILKISSALQAQNDYNNALASVTPLQQYEEGQSTTALKVVQSAGIDPATGKEIFIKLDGEKTFIYNPLDKVVVGDLLPKLSGIFYTVASYKKISLAAYFSYSYGQYIYNTTRATRVEGSDPKYNADYRVFSSRWKNPGDVTEYKSISDASVPNQTSRFAEKENVISLTRLNVSYELDNRFIKKIGFSKASVGISANDIFRASTVKIERGTSYLYSRGMDFNINVMF